MEATLIPLILGIVALLVLNVFAFAKLAKQVALVEKPREYSIIDIAHAFILEKDRDNVNKRMYPELLENQRWLLQHRVYSRDDGVFLFRYLEEWVIMQEFMDLFEPKDIKRLLQSAKARLSQEIKEKPMESEEFFRIRRQLVSIQKHLDNVEQTLNKKCKTSSGWLAIIKSSSPPPPPPRPQPSIPQPGW